MYFYLMEYKQNCTKIYIKETFFLLKCFFIRPGSKKCIFFPEYSAEAFFFAKKTIRKIKVMVFRAQKHFFFFLKGKKGRGIYVLCFKSNKNAKNRTGNACFVAIGFEINNLVERKRC